MTKINYNSFTKDQLTKEIERLHCVITENTKPTSTIQHTIMTMVEQLRSTIDNDLDGTSLNPTRREENGVEVFDMPSEKDMFLKIFMSQQIQNCHNQLVGYTTSSGSSITGLDHWVKMGKLTTEENPGFKHRYASGVINTNDLQAMKRLLVNEAKVNFVSDIKEAWELAYLEVFKEAWQPYNAGEGTSKADPKKLDPKVMARFGAKAQETLPV